MTFLAPRLDTLIPDILLVGDIATDDGSRAGEIGISITGCPFMDVVLDEVWTTSVCIDELLAYTCDCFCVGDED